MDDVSVGSPVMMSWHIPLLAIHAFTSACAVANPAPMFSAAATQEPVCE